MYIDFTIKHHLGLPNYYIYYMYIHYQALSGGAYWTLDKLDHREMVPEYREPTYSIHLIERNATSIIVKNIT